MAKGEAEQTYYGSTAGMPRHILNSRFAQAQKDMQDLGAEIARRAQFTSTEKLAERLHYLLHSGVDCDFYYSEWPARTGCRGDFWQLANNMEEWYQNVVKPQVANDYPLGQLVAFMELTKFGANYVYRGERD